MSDNNLIKEVLIKNSRLDQIDFLLKHVIQYAKFLFMIQRKLALAFF